MSIYFLLVLGNLIENFKAYFHNILSGLKAHSTLS
jgi:hypothetical protein